MSLYVSWEPEIIYAAQCSEFQGERGATPQTMGTSNGGNQQMVKTSGSGGAGISENKNIASQIEVWPGNVS